MVWFDGYGNVYMVKVFGVDDGIFYFIGEIFAW